MSVNLQFNITDAGVKALFTRMSNADFAELNDLLGQTLIAELTERFDAALAPDLTPWTPSQRALNEGGTTLTDTRILAASFSYRADAEGFLLGTPEDYGAVHHFGINETKTVNVKSHTRLVKQAFGKPLNFGVYASVGSHSRQQKLFQEERPILGLEAPQQERMDEIYLDWVGYD